MLSSPNVRIIGASCAGTALVVFLIPVLIRGCSSATIFAQKVKEARGYLQANQNEEALKVLSSTDDSSAPAEFHFLKSVTLDRLGRTEPALAEIERAIEEAPENPKYKGMQLKLKLFARDRASVNQLIALHRDHASHAAVAFFATLAFEAKATLLRKDNKPQASRHHNERRQQTLETALTLADDIPEFHPELLAFAVREKRDEHALTLVDKMLKQDPESVPLRNEKIKILVRLKETDQAVRLALELHEETGRQLKGAEFVATVMTFAESTNRTDNDFRRLVNQYPRSTLISSKYAMYLARNGRLADAEEHLDESITQQKTVESREALAFVAISLPLEAELPGVAEKHLNKYRKFFADELLVTYFEARILHLRKQYPESVRKMIEVVRESRKRGGASRIMATEALVWIRNIMTTKVINAQLERVLQATRDGKPPSDLVVEDGADGSKKPLETPDDPEESTTANGEPDESASAPDSKREASNVEP